MFGQQMFLSSNVATFFGKRVVVAIAFILSMKVLMDESVHVSDLGYAWGLLNEGTLQYLLDAEKQLLQCVDLSNTRERFIYFRSASATYSADRVQCTATLQKRHICVFFCPSIVGSYIRSSTTLLKQFYQSVSTTVEVADAHMLISTAAAYYDISIKSARCRWDAVPPLVLLVQQHSCTKHLGCVTFYNYPSDNALLVCAAHCCT
jgi:hypothetical protein